MPVTSPVQPISFTSPLSMSGKALVKSKTAASARPPDSAEAMFGFDCSGISFSVLMSKPSFKAMRLRLYCSPVPICVSAKE